MTVPTQIYNFLIEEIRKLDQQEGYQFLERYLVGPQTIWEINSEILQSIPTIWSITECPDRILQYLKNIVGWTPELDYITNELDYDSLRRLISVSVNLWKNKGPEDTINDIIYFAFNSRNRIWNWFDFRWVLDETQFGEDHQGLDPWLIELPDPDISGAENVSNLRVVEPESKIALEGIIELMRAVNETIEITYLKFLDQFLIEGDLTQWQDPITYNLTVEDSVLKVGDSLSTVEFAWTTELETNWINQVTYFRVRFWSNGGSDTATISPYGKYAYPFLSGYAISYDFSGNVNVYSFDGLIGSFTFNFYEGIWYGLRFDLSHFEGSVILKIYIDGNLEYTAISKSTSLETGYPAFNLINSYLECSEVETMYPNYMSEPYANFIDMNYENASTNDRFSIGSGGIWGGNYDTDEKPLRRILNRICVAIESRITDYAEFSENINLYLKTQTNDVITSNAIQDPTTYFGSNTAEKFTPSTDNSLHQLYRNANSVTSGKYYNLSICVRNDGSRYVNLFLPASHFDGTESAGAAYARFDLEDEVVIATNTKNTIRRLQKDWFHIAITGLCNTTDTEVPFYFGASSDTSETFASDGTSALYFWLSSLQEGYGANEATFLTSPMSNVSTSMERRESKCYWLPGNYSSVIASKKHSIIWAPHWGTDDILTDDSIIYDLYLSVSERITVLWDYTNKYVCVKRNGTDLLANTTAITFPQSSAKIINLNPIDGTIEVEGATTGGASSLVGSWKQYFTPLMTLFLGHEYDYNLATYLNGNVSEIYPTE